MGEPAYGRRRDDGVFFFDLGDYSVRIATRRPGGSPLQIFRHRRRLFEAPAQPDWLRLYAKGYALPESRGFFFPKALTTRAYDGGWPTQCRIENGVVYIEGSRCPKPWVIQLRADADQGLLMSLKTGYERVVLRSHRRTGSRIFGLGTQFTHLNLDGYRVPMISQEPGIGRGIQPLTMLLNTFVGAGGSSVQSNSPSPYFFTDDWCGYFLDGHAVSFLDFQLDREMIWDVNHGEADLRMWSESDPASLLSRYTAFIGRMRPLPDWTHRGAIVGVQGGSNRLQVLHQTLSQAGSSISAYWLQDWVGQRRTSIGWQLWWNWELDKDHYPDWEVDLSRFSDEDIRVMTYINPFLVDMKEKSNVRRDLFEEAVRLGYLVKNAKGKPYAIGHTSFSTYMVDFTHPAARTWIKQVVTDQVLAVGASGWMTDFGEALPCDATLYDGRSAADYHNEYPIEWAKLVDEAVIESGRTDIVPFHRSGFHRSPRYARLFWLGDQLISWRREDGIKSALLGLLSSGMSGFSLNHSDIGGYTSTDLLPGAVRLRGVSFYRRKELLFRWIELNAFTAVFRTHEGNQPGKNVQVDAGGDVTDHFAYFSRVFASLFSYRKREMRAIITDGTPLVRPIWFHHPNHLAKCEDLLAFCLGTHIFVYPVLDRSRHMVEVFLPPGTYRHLFTGEVYEGNRSFKQLAPMGRPAVFVEEGCPDLDELLSGVMDIPRPRHLMDC